MKKRLSGPRPEPGIVTAPSDSEDLAEEVARLRHALELSEHERMQSAERDARLRGELQHRVRNMLAVVRSISARTFAGSDENEAADHFRGRLDALSRFEMGGSRKAGFDFEEMLRDELRSFEFDARIEVKGPETLVPHEIARLLGLAIHELVTNSIKFGALSTGDARTALSVRWTVARTKFRLVWQESGVAVMGVAPTRFGFGREYIEQALPYQTGAITGFELLPGGLRCVVEIELSAAETADNWPRAWV